MATRVLFLINGPGKESAALIGQRFEDSGLTVDYHWAFNDEFPDTVDRYGAVFLSGSPHGAYEDIDFIHREHDVVRDVVERGLPTLGVCFGSQILASALCDRDQVFRRTTCDVGYKPLRRSDTAPGDAIAKDLRPRFPMFVWHNDDVRANHPDMVVLASSDDCPNQVWRYRDQPVWGIQGHPEFTPAYVEALMLSRLDRIGRSAVEEARKTLGGKVHREIITRWIENFLKGAC
ncbi:MAG: type 1 glutamine amidotransferase [Alphaproteobacteria bacterium]|nr:type 1 glutamine amidotransferase [Alphaproteobacteria bacterium]